MRLGAQRQDEFEINVISLIDVMLTLLMFFVMTTTFVQHSALKVTLPQASEKLEEAPKNPLIVKWTRQLVPLQFELSTTPRVPAGTSCEKNPPLILTRASTLSPCENDAICCSLLCCGSTGNQAMASDPYPMRGAC